MASRFWHMASIVKEALFPARCICCESICPWPVFKTASSTLSGYLCPQCDARLTPIRSPLCLRCGRPFASDQGVDHVCGTCQGKNYAFQSARAAGEYVDSLKALIHQYKYRSCEPLAGPLGRLLWAAFRRYWQLDDVDVIVPVPLHWRRLRKRGFNQSGLLLRTWPRLAAQQRIDFNGVQVLSEIVVRRRYTAPQTGLDRKARQENVRNAFEMGKGTVSGLHVLLIDDVLTTGATAHACAQVLKQDGAASVKLLTLARAVD